MTAADRPIRLNFRLDAGERVDHALARGFEAAGCIGGFVGFEGGTCAPFQYVIPAASPDDGHAAWYSAPLTPEGPVDLRQCGAIVGLRDGQLYGHCHGLWHTATGLCMGHMLTPLCVLTAPVMAAGFGFRNATFRSMPDEESGFTLFEPTGGSDRGGAPSALLLRIRPNEDLCQAIEAVCEAHGIESAEVHGIGSLNEVRFADGRQVSSYATEILIRHGRVGPEGQGVRARIDIAVVDMSGRVAVGEIVRGDNPVCVTCELVLVPT
ncbi:PCC domain-containing protein [Microvirga antarctica]|uniref:PCC domain-containing protein n=1 Tax=Microvirga antarctica TaxID=2819233 RepID=UPI001B30A2A0